jgi:LysM repeat protein
MALPNPSANPTPRLCPVCGTRVGEAATKCIVCGSNLNREETKQRGTLPLPLVSKSASLPSQASTPGLTQPMPVPSVGNTGAMNASGNPNSQPLLPSQLASAAAPTVKPGQITIPMPLFIGILLLVVVGGVALTLFFVSQNGLTMLQKVTPTLTATATKFPTLTPLPTSTPTFTPTLTPLPPLTHTVSEGETCGYVAYRYGVSIKAITELNGLPSDCPVFLNQKLLIPQPTATPAPTGSSTVPASAMTQAARPTHKVSGW